MSLGFQQLQASRFNVGTTFDAVGLSLSLHLTLTVTAVEPIFALPEIVYCIGADEVLLPGPQPHYDESHGAMTTACDLKAFLSRPA
jgi:hypothetical protein